jgi:glycosyltransferase involved in cell wall biosynthesis
VSSSVEVWSSVDLGGIARGLTRELEALGWQARHRFEVSDDAYRGAASRLDRTRVRWSSYVSYPLHLRRRLRAEPPPAAIIVCTNTFYAPAVALREARRLGVPLIHWVFDLFPDVLVHSAKLRSGGLSERAFSAVTRAIFRDAAANVFLGEKLLSHARSRYSAIRNAIVIPVGADGRDFAAAAPQPRAADTALQLLYCGNLGRMHDTETILGLLARRRPQGWTMEFRGHGAGFRSLAAAPSVIAAGAAVVLGGGLPAGAWAEAMRNADIALVTMKSGAERLVMPSKTYSAMVAGQAILAICPLDSDLADTVRRHQAGWVVVPGDIDGLEAAIADAVAHPATVLAWRRNAFRAGHDLYDQRPLAARWDGLLRSLVSG